MLRLESIENLLALKSANTQKTYKYVLDQFFAHCKAQTNKQKDNLLLNASSAEALSFIASLKGHADSTIRLSYNALRSMFHMLEAMKLRDGNPFDAVKYGISWRQKRQVRPTARLTITQVKMVMRQPNRLTRKGVRDAAILGLLFGGGLRRSEVIGLAVGSVKVTEAETLYVRLLNTKSGEPRDQSLPTWANELVADLVAQRKTEGADNSDPLFVSYRVDDSIRGPLSVETLYRMYRRYCLNAGIKAAPHSARVTAASRLKELGLEDRDVAGFLGHATTRQVEVYDKRARNLDQAPGVSIWYD